jgi:hypothetical protein
VGAGCVEESGSDATLAPLPIPPIGATTTTVAAAVTTTTAPAATTAVAPTTTLAAQPVGEWDGAQFDIGKIVGDGEEDIYRTIELDRYSYQDPTIGLVDAAGLTYEPLPYWWTESPFVNNNPATRVFVLAPNVELLTLDPSGNDAACTNPPPVPLPEPQWIGVDISFLDTGAARRSIAVISYAPTGPITRIRFTHGCDG